MTDAMRQLDPIRVLVVDDEPGVLEAYREVLSSPAPIGASEVERLRARLFNTSAPAQESLTRFEVHSAAQAEAGVATARAARGRAWLRRRVSGHADAAGA